MRIFRRIMLNSGLNIDIDSLPETQKIYYTATAKVTPKSGTIGTVLVNNYNNKTGQGVIYSSADIIKIGNDAFEQNKTLNSIILPDCVIEIGEQAFAFCTGLHEIVIPSSIQTIGGSAFTSSKNIKYNITDLSAWCKIVRPSMSSNAYQSTLFLNNVEVVDLVIPTDVTIIQSYSFSDFNSIKSVTIHDQVESIKMRAFSSCEKLEEVVIGDGVTTIDEGAFYHSGVKRVKIGKNVKLINYNAFAVSVQNSYFDFSSHDTIPSIDYDTFPYPDVHLYSIIVPDSLYDKWIVNTNWSEYADHIIKKSDWDASQVTE